MPATKKHSRHHDQRELEGGSDDHRRNSRRSGITSQRRSYHNDAVGDGDGNDDDGGHRKRKRQHGRDHSRSPERRQAQLHRQRYSTPPGPVILPCNAPLLDKDRDYRTYRALLGLYLDIQKQLDIEELDAREVRGRWKSFVGKWNRAELAEGWYDASTLCRVQEAEAENNATSTKLETDPDHNQVLASYPAVSLSTDKSLPDDEQESSGSDYGPALQSSKEATSRPRPSAGHPCFDDIALQREQAQEDQMQAIVKLKQERRNYRKQEQAKLDEMAPKAEAGTRERQLEKRREAAASNKAFAASRADGGAMEVGDEDLMGGADGADDYRRMKKEMERKKNDREIRREEILRARQVERQDRLRAYRQKEDKTMAGLIALARQKYG